MPSSVRKTRTQTGKLPARVQNKEFVSSSDIGCYEITGYPSGNGAVTMRPVVLVTPAHATRGEPLTPTEGSEHGSDDGTRDGMDDDSQDLAQGRVYCRSRSSGEDDDGHDASSQYAPEECSGDRATENPDDVEEVRAEELIPTNVDDVIQTFSTDTKMADGLWAVHNLGNNQYKMINLSVVGYDVFTSKEMGRILTEQKHAKIFETMATDSGKFKSTVYKTSQAVASAKLRIFRFMDLPIELRMIVYDYTISSDTRLEFRSRRRDDLGLALMSTCSAILKETRPFFFNNLLQVDNILRLQALETGYGNLTAMLTNIYFLWHEGKNLTYKMLRFIGSLVNLKKLKLGITRRLIVNSQGRNRGQHLYQQDPRTAKFRQLWGFDLLVQIRGLEKVAVQIIYGASPPRNPSPIVTSMDREFEDFNTFLNAICTEPKGSSIPGARIAGPRSVRRVKIAKKKQKHVDTDDDSEASDAEYQSVRSRKRKRIAG